LKVTIFERLPRVGGRTSAIEQDGFRFDLGPTFFLYPKILKSIYAAVGRDLADEVELRRLDPQYRLVFGEGGELVATPSVERMEQAIARLSPLDAGNLRRFLADNRHKLASFEPFLQSAFLGWRDLLRWQVLKVLPQLRPWSSLDQELSRYFRDPRVRLAFSFQAKYLGMSPFSCPSLFSILSFLEYEHGVYHPVGGCAAVMESMATVALDLGVELRLGEPVEEIILSNGRARGVRTQRGALEADAVVVNADFAQAMTRLLPDHARRRWTDRAIAGKQYSCSTFMMYLGIEGRFDHIHHHTIYIAKDYARNLREIEYDHVLSNDPSFYVQNACATDPSLAPAGHSTLYVLAPVTHVHPNVDWRVETSRFRRRMLRQIERIGLADVERRIRFERIVTPQDWQIGYEIYRGATFSLAHTLRQMLHLRPRNRFEDIPGMYLVGGGTHPGSGLPVIFESARITSRLVLEDLDLGGRWLENPSSVKESPSLAEVA
jgi:phytoene desaturase